MQSVFGEGAEDAVSMDGVSNENDAISEENEELAHSSVVEEGYVDVGVEESDDQFYRREDIDTLEVGQAD